MAEDIVLTQEEQEEQVKKWLKKNLPAIVVGISLGLVLTYGYNYYKDSKESQAKQASTIYEEILSADNSDELAAEKVALFKSDYAHTPYTAKIALLNAKNLADNAKTQEAIAELSWVVDNSKEDLVTHTARLRKAQLLIDSGEISDAQAVLRVKDIEGFESHYQELLGDVAAKKSDYKTAISSYQSALSTSVDPRHNTYLQLKLNKMKSLSIAQ